MRTFDDLLRDGILATLLDRGVRGTGYVWVYTYLGETSEEFEN